LQLFFAGVFFTGSALAANELPLFGAHIHYNVDAQAIYAWQGSPELVPSCQ
jgi:hypothetical protein